MVKVGEKYEDNNGVRAKDEKHYKLQRIGF